MIELDHSKFGFKIKEIWFADAPYDVKGADVVYFHACKNKKDIDGFNCSEITTLTIELTQDLETIWQNMSKSSCRYAINKAKKDGVVVAITAQGNGGFWKMDNAFRISKGIKEHYTSIDKLKTNAVLLLALSDNKELLSGQLYIYDDKIIRLTFGSSKRLQVSKETATLIGNANRLLVWKSIEWAKNAGIKTFDFGGYSPETHPTIASFKKSFGGVVTPYYTYTKIYSKLLKSLRVML